uniref:Uncharacterized protein LOC104233045 n=1 Tax=Nicotiana sylvestris TaxID=4096 RepID=A0A1U7XCI7_NICSY|nr:PREDICTED: uncharacterized protein LOC104233045 [Nicotiana sylvestris]
MLADAFVKAHAGAIKVETRKSNLFKVKQRDNKMLRKFVSRFQMERMDLPPVADDWAFQAFTQQFQSKIRFEDNQLGDLSGSIYQIRTNYRSKRVVDHKPRLSRDWCQPSSRDRSGSKSGRNPVRNEKISDRGHNSLGLMGKNGFDRPLGAREAPRLSEYNFTVDATSIISSIEHIKDTKWPRPLQSDPAQRDLNLMCKYHGTHGYKTEDCRQLKEEVSRLFNSGHLREFLTDLAKTK